MRKDAEYAIQKDIPLGDGACIQKGRTLYRTHGCYLLDGGMLSKSYQEDFEHLIDYEEKHGWKYLVPIVKRTGSSIINK